MFFLLFSSTVQQQALEDEMRLLGTPPKTR